MIKSVGFILCCFLWCASLFYIPAAAIAQTVEEYTQQGMAAFQNKEYKKSYDLFLNAFELVPDHFGINFYLGRSAYEIRHYEMAVMVYERALIIKPEDNRVKLEMARAFQKLGVYDMARKYCNEVLLSDPPETVRQNIELFLAYIDRFEQRHFFRGTITLGLDWNDNVWSSPSDNIISTALGELVLTGSASKEIDDVVYSAIVDVTHTYSFLYSKWNWQTNGVGYKALYHTENNLDTLFLSLETGPDYIFSQGVAGIRITGDYMDLDYAKYSDAIGTKAFYRHIFAPALVMTPSIMFQNRKFQTTAGRNADNVRLELDTAFVVKGMWCNAVLGYERENANNFEYRYHRYRFKLSANKEIIQGVTLFGSYSYYYSTYDGTGFLFDNPRKDHIHILSCGIKKRLWQSKDRRNRLSVSLGYRHTRANANLELYEYTKNIINSAIEYRF